MSQRKGGRFSYLATDNRQPEVPAEQRPERIRQDSAGESKTPKQNSKTNSEQRRAAQSGGEGGSESASTTVDIKTKAPANRKGKARSRKMPPADVRTVPKGQGRMKQDRSQLNVRIPTTLKRRASAKAVLEGREIGEIVEGLLQEYISK